MECRQGGDRNKLINSLFFSFSLFVSVTTMTRTLQLLSAVYCALCVMCVLVFGIPVSDRALNSRSSSFPVDSAGVPIIPIPTGVLSASVIAEIGTEEQQEQTQGAEQPDQQTPQVPRLSAVEEALIRRLVDDIKKSGVSTRENEKQGFVELEAESNDDSSDDSSADEGADESDVPKVTADSDPKLIFSQRRYRRSPPPEPFRGVSPTEHKDAKHFIDTYAQENNGEWDTKNDQIRTVNGINVGFHNPKSESKSWGYWKTD